MRVEQRHRLSTTSSRGEALKTKTSMENPDREAHNKMQNTVFNSTATVANFKDPISENVRKRLQIIASSVSGLPSDARIIDVGSGTGCLIPHLKALGLSNILAVDLSPKMLSELEKEFPNPGTLGNDLGVRTWCGDIVDLPQFMWPVDAIFMNSMFGNMYMPDAALLHCALMLQPGGKIIISHPLGRAWQTQLHNKHPDTVPHALPDRSELEAMLHGLPLQLSQWTDEQDLYTAVVEVPPLYSFKGSPTYLDGIVVVGMGRGSKQMGVPTANLDPQPLKDQLEELPKGVYFGWAQLKPNSDFPKEDGAVHPMVMNIGERPTLEDGRGVTVEAHIMHEYTDDFHGQRLKLLVLGFLRPEVKFSGLSALINRIRTDIGISKNQLQSPELTRFCEDVFFE